MAKGVKKIKWVGKSGALKEYSEANSILCIQPDQEAPFLVGEWYNETTEEQKRSNITWLWMDQKKENIFKKTVKAAGEPFGVKLPKKLCGTYAYYLEASLYGVHDTRPTGLYVYGKCEEKIISSSWSKKENATDKSEINYGHNLSISLEAEGLNGDTLTLELYSVKTPLQLIPSITPPMPIHTVKEKCINGKLKVKMPTGPCYMAVLNGIQELENFYIKVLDLTGKYIKNSSGSDKIISFTIKNKWVIPTIETPTNSTTARVGAVEQDPVEVEKKQGFLKAYFAKEEFSLETDEAAGEHEYKFQKVNNAIKKDITASIIKKRVDAQVKADKKYAKLDDIKNVLTEGSNYGIDAVISFPLCKLGAKFIKINSAPLEEEVYVVAETFLLDGKEVSIKIKEKEALLYEPDIDVTVLEAKEGGSDITELKAVVENGIAKVKIKLRPKADEDLKTWKEKLAGIKDGTHTYTFGSDNPTGTAEEKKKIASIIANKIKAALTEQKKFAKVDVIEKALENALYKKDEQITFDVYKIVTENLWLAAECQGDDKKYEGEFLKRDGEYFVIGTGKCPRCEEDFKYEDVVKIFPAASKNKSLAENLITEINKLKVKYEINTCIRKAHLITQFGSETGFNTLVEAIDGYNVNTLKTLFGYFKRHPDEAETYKGNLYEIAVRAYGLRKVDKEEDIVACNLVPGDNCNDLGNENKEDGYKYIGRGLIQLTGKYNYSLINNAFKKAFPNKGNLITNPELLEEPEYAAMSAFSYWINNKLNSKADLGFNPNNVDELTKIINKNLDQSHYEKRRKSFLKAKDVYRLTECTYSKTSDTETENITIRLIRKWETEISTIGEFTIDNTTITGFILEEKGPDTKTSGLEQRIPIGTYNMVMHNGTKFKNVLKLYNNDVSIDRAILIHSGNSAADTEGCLVVGTTRSEDWVSSSKDKLNEIMEHVKVAGIENAKIIITEQYE